MSTETTTSPKSPTVVLLLCIFLGGFGIHRFYVGKIGTGILMLLTLGGLGIWNLIDLALIISNKFTDKHNRVVELAKNPPNVKKVLSVFAVIIIGFYGLIISMITAAILATNVLVVVAQNQLTALRSGDINKAYSYTSSEFQKNTTAENFGKFVQEYQLENNVSASFPVRNIKNDNGEIEGTVKFKDGTVFLIEYRFKKEDDEWKILGVGLKRTEPE